MEARLLGSGPPPHEDPLAITYFVQLKRIYTHFLVVIYTISKFGATAPSGRKVGARESREGIFHSQGNHPWFASRPENRNTFESSREGFFVNKV